MAEDIFYLLLLLIFVIIIHLIEKRMGFTNSISGGKVSTTYTYYLDPISNEVDDNFISETRKILTNSSINDRFDIVEVDRPNKNSIIIKLLSREEMIEIRNKDGGKTEYYLDDNGNETDKNIFFSWTYQKPQPTILIDGNNWKYGIEESGLSLDEYKLYVIQHEFLHALGFDHQPCNEKTAVNGRCPILYQSTRGCPKGFACGYEVTEFDYNKKISGSYF